MLIMGFVFSAQVLLRGGFHFALILLSFPQCGKRRGL